MTTAVQVDGALVETLRQRLGPEALVQLTLTVAAANFTNRFNEALGTELEREEARDACHRAARRLLLRAGAQQAGRRRARPRRAPGGRHQPGRVRPLPGGPWLPARLRARRRRRLPGLCPALEVEDHGAQARLPAGRR